MVIPPKNSFSLMTCPLFPRKDKRALEQKLSGLRIMNQKRMLVPLTEVVEIIATKSKVIEVLGSANNPQPTQAKIARYLKVSAAMISKVFKGVK